MCLCARARMWGQACCGSSTQARTTALCALLLRPALYCPYAVQVTRDAATGELKRTPSWHSFGSTADSEDEEGGKEGAEDEEVGEKGADGATLAAIPARGGAAAASGSYGSGKAPSVRVRRISTCTEVVYTPVEPAVPL